MSNSGESKVAKCGQKCEIFSRVCGYYRPVANWNLAKKEEFKDRKEYKIQDIFLTNPKNDVIVSDKPSIRGERYTNEQEERKAG